MRRSFPLLIIGAVLLLAVGGGFLLLKWKQQQQPVQTVPIPVVEPTPAMLETPAEVGNPGGAETPPIAETPAVTIAAPEPLHVRGNAMAQVTLEEYGDFQCPPCGRFYPVLKAAEHEYGDRLRVVFRHMPLRKHEHALLAARAAEAAGLQGRFWEMHDMLYENALRWSKGIDSIGPDAPPSRRLESNILAMDLEVRDVFFRYAEVLRLDVERFKQDLDSEPVRERVESDRAHGAGLGIDRTPTIYVNGHHIASPSAFTAEGLHEVIEAALAGKTYEPPASPSPSGTPKGSR